MPLYPRFVEQLVREALAESRVVLVVGPRQAGKTTLVRQIAGRDVPFHTLDNTATLSLAQADPIGFVRGLDRAVIDEVQRAPELMLAIKESVDNDRRPGRFLLTGSANLLTLPRVADSLAGRMQIVRLLPLAQAELRAHRPRLLSDVFSGTAPRAGEPLLGEALVETVIAGSYPEALARSTSRSRETWYLDYVEAIIQRDVRDVARIDQAAEMPRLLRALAQQAGGLVNWSGVGAPLGLSHVTTQRYAGILEQLFLIRSVPPWYTNVLKRLVKTPKLHFLDSGVLAALRGLTLEGLREDRDPFGALLETFVHGELLKLASWHDRRLELSHFREAQKHEVDFVVEDQAGRLAGFEVKASATVRGTDFAGLRRLAEACGKRFALGLVLYDGEKVIPAGENLFAAPISCLWQ